MAGKLERVYKVALFGATGCGKSSIINLLADKPVANVSMGVDTCTRRAQSYPVSVGEKTFRLWDTMGFNQAEAKDIDSLAPYKQAHALLQGGVDLILLCAHKNGINASLRNLYWLLDSFFFGGQAQIALVLTHFDTPGEEWWDRNKHIIAQRCNFPAQSLPHACITTVRDESPQFESICDQSRQALIKLLQEHAVTPTPLRLDLSSDVARAEAAKSLKNHCQLRTRDATMLVDKFRSQKRPFNVVLFGAAGAGKSSVTDLIVGSRTQDFCSYDINTGLYQFLVWENVPPASGPSSRSSFESCPLDFCSYEVKMGLRQFLVWDTVGLDGVYNENDVSRKALENAARLVRDLHKKGGVDLLVFCKKYGRLSPSELNNLRLFREFLCGGKMPVAIIITHLEAENPMEKWWEMNGKGLLMACNLDGSAVAGHACITSAPDNLNDQKLWDKRSLSRQLVQAMFEDSITYGSSFTKDEGVWVMSFLKGLMGMVRVGRPSEREKISVKSLMDSCGLTREQAEELVKLSRA